MKRAASIPVLISLVFSLSATVLANAEVEPTASDPPDKSSTSDEHNKLLLQCQHPDYRTYIKCLKRQKRHHLHSSHDSDGGETKRCFDDCGMEQCESSKCVHECHKRCLKKMKETHQIITEYETTCGGDDCTDKSGKAAGLPTTNVTTNIDINNVINNHPSQPNRPNNQPNWPNQPNSPNSPDSPNWPCNGGFGCLSLVPQIQFVPQITFGLGMAQPGRTDCWYCGNPLMRYRCDVSCYPMQGSGSSGALPPNGERLGASNANCISPHCVGGT
ncbi:sporozoite surface protein 2-like [Venturia canescens]|uniref:sporozoite surface protein 2-like n=1 Tax=Venturia canescens TaxID=32260 RepID=UPI001C9C0C7F|nr:sporozoite surface protein 2-like [Venturia canescens]